MKLSMQAELQARSDLEAIREAEANGMEHEASIGKRKLATL